MKYIILGLGNFGSLLAQKLTLAGHEVIGVDMLMSRVESSKERISHTICLDPTDLDSVSSLPVGEVDAAIVSIDQDEGRNIIASAVLKELGVKRLISMANSPRHATILEAVGVDDIILPESECADRLANKLIVKGVIDSYELAAGYCVVHATVPDRFFGKTVAETGLNEDFDLVVLTTIRTAQPSGPAKGKLLADAPASAATVLYSGDIMLVYGKFDDIQRMLENE